MNTAIPMQSLYTHECMGLLCAQGDIGSSVPNHITMRYCFTAKGGFLMLRMYQDIACLSFYFMQPSGKHCSAHPRRRSRR